MLYSWSLADCAKSEDSKLVSKNGQKLWDRLRRPTAFASSALPTKRHRDRLKVLSVQPRLASFWSHRRSVHLSIRQLEPFGRSKVSPLRLCDGVESNDSVPDPGEKAQGQSQSSRTLSFRYTVPVDPEARGLVLLRQDWLRFRSWIIRRGRAEFLHYDIEAFSRFYHRRLDLMIARALEMALPLSLWFWRYRWRMRDPNVKRALASERGLRIDPRSAAELRALATRLGAAAIKLGQALSSRPDIVGPTFMLELQKLQDNVDPFPNREAWALMNVELGPAFISQLFGASSKSDAGLPNPVASASLGQVYRGRHADTGMEVAVKVQRPRLHLDVPLDLLILRWLASWLRKYFRLRSDLPAILDEFGQRLFEEMDYVHEGENAERFRALYARSTGTARGDVTLRDKILVPRILWSHTTPYVLTMEWIQGLKPSQWDKQDALRLIRIGVACSLEQLLDDGFFHADPHPGNFLCSIPERRLVYLDFGCMAELDADKRYHLIMAITHLINKDYSELGRDLVALDFLPQDMDPIPVSRAIEEAFEASKRASDADAARNRQRATLTSLNFATLTANLGRVAFAFPIRIPARLALVMRSLTALEGLALSYDPNFKIVDAAYPYVARRLLFAPTPTLRAAVQQVLLDSHSRRIRWNRLYTMIEQSSLAVSSASYASKDSVDAVHPATVLPDRGLPSMWVSAAPTKGDILEPITESAAWNLAIEYLLSEEGLFLREGLLNELVDTVDDLQLALQQQFSRLTFGLVPTFGEPNYARLRAIQEILLTQLLPPLPRELDSAPRRLDLNALRRNPHIWRLFIRELFQDSRVLVGKLVERKSVRFWQLLLQRAEKALEQEIQVRKRTSPPVEETPS